MITFSLENGGCLNTPFSLVVCFGSQGSPCLVYCAAGGSAGGQVSFTQTLGDVLMGSSVLCIIQASGAQKETYLRFLFCFQTSNCFFPESGWWSRRGQHLPSGMEAQQWRGGRAGAGWGGVLLGVHMVFHWQLLICSSTKKSEGHFYRYCFKNWTCARKFQNWSCTWNPSGQVRWFRVWKLTLTLTLHLRMLETEAMLN